jgi:hypothetical protein
MIRLNAHIFYAMAQEIESTRAHVAVLSGVGEREVPETIKEHCPDSLIAIIEHCQSIGLTEVIPHIKRMLEIFEGQFGGYNCTRLAYDLQQLQWRVVDELSNALFMRVPKDAADYYDKPSLFGQQVADNFSDATYDISEAGSCYATDRYTACVMHLMRSLEVALDTVGLGVGISNAVIEAQNSWERLLERIRKQIEANDKSGDSTWPPKRQFFVDMQAHLFAVKNAWRNPSMHLEKKYNEKEALRIYNAVKDFMEHLATHLDASGNYTF